MKLTNKFNLPAPFVRAVEDDYELVGDISVTGFINPIRQTVLMRRHWDEIAEDASDRVWSLLGSAAHVVLERATKAPQIPEKRLAMWIRDGSIRPIPLENAKELMNTAHEGLVVSGRSDLLEPEIAGLGTEWTLTDWKVTSAWTHVFGSRLEDWTAQLSLYAYLYEIHGYRIEKARIIEIFRDWDKRKANDESYPQLPIMEVPIKLWTFEKTSDYLHERSKALLEAMELPDEELPECSPQERWARPSRWAIYKTKKARRAYRVVESRDDARAIQAKLRLSGANPKMELREGADVRCASYCPVARFCSYYKARHNEEIN